MTPFPKILVGDIFDKLAEIEDENIDCVVTSPPYWGLRDYGVAGQLGLEPTLAEHIAIVVKYCREIKRVLKSGGTFWLNYGDCYATSPNGRSASATKKSGKDDRTFRDKPFSTIQGSLKPKDLCMVPNRIAIALQDDGWFVRSEIIWAKPNPMPESIKDRPATSHEKIFLLTKNGKYSYDAESVRIERATTNLYKVPDGWDTGPGGHGNIHRKGREKGKPVSSRKRELDPRHKEGDHQHTGLNAVARGSRNLRNYEPAPETNPAYDQPEVWRFSTAAFRDAHFATFPPELVERCIKAGCPEGGLVLDPFGGSGTTGMVAHRLQRQCILIELNPEYAALARRRIIGDAPLFSAGAA